jgi:hypothetical protein
MLHAKPVHLGDGCVVLDVEDLQLSRVLLRKFVEQIVAGSRRLPVRASRRRKGWH